MSASGETIDATGMHRALFVFARFSDGMDIDPGNPESSAPIPRSECSGCGPGWPAGTTTLPEWAHDFLEDVVPPEQPGTLSHLFYEMSKGSPTLPHYLTGETFPSVVVADHTIAHYAQGGGGGIAEANRQLIIKLVEDYNVDFRDYDLAGGVGGGPDGVVDYLFINWQSTRTAYEVGQNWVYHNLLAAGISNLGYLNSIVFGDPGDQIRVARESGTMMTAIRQHPAGSDPVFVRHPWMIGAVAAHEYGHDLVGVGNVVGGCNAGHITTEGPYGLMNGSMTPPVMMMSGIMRLKLGWIDPPVVGFPTSFPFETEIDLSADYEDANQCFAIVRTHVTDPEPPKESQYFLLEARKPIEGKVYNAANPVEYPNCCYPMREVGEGLLIAHVRDGGACCYPMETPPPLWDARPPLLSPEIATGLFNLDTGAMDPIRGLNRLTYDSRKVCKQPPHDPPSEGPASGQPGDLFRPRRNDDVWLTNLFSPFTNPNTNLYVDEPAAVPTEQSVYSGITIYDIDWVGSTNDIRVKIRFEDPSSPPPAGGADTLRTDVTLDGGLQLTGDLVVASGTKLTVAEGSTIVASALSDRHAGGVSSSHVEVIPVGILSVEGTESHPVAVTSSRDDEFDEQDFRDGWPGSPVPDGGSPAPGDWDGFRIKSASTSEQSTLLYPEFKFSRIAVSVDSLSGSLFKPKFVGSEVADIFIDRSLRTPHGQMWIVEAPSNFKVANTDAWAQPGSDGRIEWLVEGDFHLLSEPSAAGSQGIPRNTILPVILTPETGDAWNGFTVFPGAQFRVKDSEIGYAERPVQLLAAALGCVVERSHIHHYKETGILDWATHSSVVGSRIERGTGLDNDLGLIGVHLASSYAVIEADTVGMHLEYGIKAEFAAGTCAIPGATQPGVLTIVGNRVVADEEPQNEVDPNVGIFVSWVCDSISAVLDQNVVRSWTRGVAIDHCADVAVTCNVIDDNFTGLLYNRDVGMPVNSRNGLVKFNQNAVKSNFDSGMTIPVGLGLRVGDVAVPPNPGKNSVQLNDEGSSKFLRVVVADPFIGSSTLDARRNTWLKADASVTQSGSYIQSKVSEDFPFQVNAGHPRGAEGLCSTMPSGAMLGASPQAQVEDEKGASGRLPESCIEVVKIPAVARAGEPIIFFVRGRTIEAADFALDVLDVTGRRIRRLYGTVGGNKESAFGWDGRDSDGRFVAPQVLFLRFEGGASFVTRKLVVVR